MDTVIEYWENNPYVKHITNLDDLGQPYSCEQWNNLSNTPYLIIDDGLNNDLYMMFHNQDSYPTYVLIDHNMVVYHKGNGLSTWVINQNINEMLDNCGVLCSWNSSTADINFDGDINILDIIELANIILNDDSSEVGDINNDGIINILDIITIVNIILINNNT